MSDSHVPLPGARPPSRIVFASERTAACFPKVGRHVKVEIPLPGETGFSDCLSLALRVRRTSMTSRLTCLALWSARMGLVLVCAAASAEEANRVQIHTDFTEGDASLAILNERHAG